MAKFYTSREDEFGNKIIPEAATSHTYDKNGKSVDDKFTEVTAQLAHIEEMDAINPDTLIGTDYEKMQQAFDLAVSTRKAIKISRVYDIGSNTISLKKSATLGRYPTRIFGGGTIKRLATGFMFAAPDMTISMPAADYFFTDITFEGARNAIDQDVKVFDGTDQKMINIVIDRCSFNKIHTVFYSDIYAQSIKVSRSNVFDCTHAFFDVGGMINVTCDTVVYEASAGNFIKNRGEGQYTHVYNVNVVNCLFQSNHTNPVLNIKGAFGLNISGNYFELNMAGNIVFSDKEGFQYKNVSISDNHHEGHADTEALIVWGRTVTNCKSFSNYSSIIPVHDTTNIVSGYVTSENDGSETGILDINANSKLSVVEPNAIVRKGSLTAVDLNTITDAGIYGVTNGLNTPIATGAGDTSATLEVYGRLQRFTAYFDHLDAITYQRVRISASTWGAWKLKSNTLNGSGNPEGVVAYSPGHFYRDTTNHNLYYKQTGIGNTGWKLVTLA